MKKIVSLLSALAMMFTLVTTVAFADENNSVYFEETEKTATSVTLKLVVETNQTLRQIGVTVDLADAFAKGATVSNFEALSSDYIFNVNSTAKVLSTSYTDVTGKSGKFEMGTVTFDLTNVTESFTFAQKRALSIKTTDGTDVASMFTNTAYDYTVEVTPPTTEYEVTFKADGVQVGEVIKVAENGTVAELPEAPAKEGFTFSKWVIEGTETEFTTETPVTADITVVAVYTEDEKPASVELGTIEKGGDMYGQNTAVTSMSFANVAAPKVKISLGSESKDYELPSGVVGGTTRLIGIVRYQKGTTGTFTITVLDGAEELASDTFEAVAE